QMKNLNIIPKRKKSSYLLRTTIPKDLVDTFGGRTRFHISLKNVSNKERHLVSIFLKSLTKELFNDIRMGMKSLGVDDIREILKVEVRKSILHSHQVNLGTNKYDPEKVEDSLKSVSTREEKMKQKLKGDLKTYEGILDDKLEKILLSLDIEYDNKSVNYRELRRYFIDLYLLRFDFIRSLINETGRTDDDFRLEVEEKLKVELFPELKQQLTPVVENYIPEPTQPYRVETPLTPHQSTPLSVGIKNYLDERGKIRTKSLEEINNSLNLMIEEWGDIPIGSVIREMSTNFKGHIRKLPKNRNKNPLYRDKNYHELVKMNVKDSIHTTTINKHIGYSSSFYEWSINHGYSTINPFKGLKLKKEVRPRDERDRFTDLELKKIFGKENYIHFTKIEERRYELYWTPLIGVFSGLRLGEITSLYLDNIKEIKGSHRKKRWCFDIVVEPERTDKHLKTQSSRRIVPVHDTLMELGLIEFIELLKKKDSKRERLFQELPYREGGYNQNVSRFFNRRYLPSLGLKTNKKNFHSFRHTVSDHLKQKGIEPHFVNELLGHSTGNIDLERYGKGYNPDILYNKCVKKIFYETSHTRGIDFKSLKMDWKKIIG
ncbi:MAG: site-specific integrase, partial [Nitrosopumilus sp.]|nr:site-specific integrase [Nitrosopumilus sp.]